MKKVLLFLLIAFGMNAMAQQAIHLRSANRAECVKSDMSSLRASFSFSTIEAENVDTQRGLFSWLSIQNTVIGGNVGDPQIPVVNELIAVPFGAQPRIEITSYSTTDYRLEDLGIQTLIPRQPSLRKDQRPEDVPFLYNESAYQTRGLRSQPQAVVHVVGTMRGVQLGKMTIEPVSYDPVNNTLRVFNDIEVEVHFDGADAVATEEMLVKTYSPYFDIVYKQLFNNMAIRSIYDQHPDLYTTPVKMLVVTTSTYANSTAFQNWLTWKKQKGIDVDVQTVANNASADNIKNLIYSRYNANHPSFLVIVGDETIVTYYQLWNYNSTHGNAATDLEYASVDGDIYHDMFMSRMSVSSTTELDNLVNKILTYEKYTMSDPSYLSKVLLIAGADNTWAPRVGRPTINYAANNYFNTAHGFTNVYKYVNNSYSGCYNYLSSGVGFANYTAHGDIQKWHNPLFNNDNVANLTNSDKYFWAMGNCCLTCNFKNVQNDYTCFGEALIRAANKGAFGYIGSIPETYWYEDYYFGVGATTVINQTPNMSQTQTGAYDAMFDDSGFNTLNAVPFTGNLAVSYAYSGSYSLSGGSCSEEYYWRAYHCFGDGSVMPYHTQPAANNVSHNDVLPLGTSSFTVSAEAGSYVSITVNNEIIGVAQVPESGTVDVPIIEQNTVGDAMIVVTRNQRQPYITTIPMEGGTQYTITIASVMHGTISCDHTMASNNNLITLTATPESGYYFENWVVFKTGDVNTSVTVTDNTFTMPDYDVTVSAIFSKPAGGDVTIGSGNDNSTYIPTNAYWRYTLSQQIYKPSEIGSAGTITKIAFKVANSKSANRIINIYMSHTSTNAFSNNSAWIAQNTSYRVFSGSVTFNASGWTTITLDTPFQYNGSSNLLLTVDDNTGSRLNSNNTPSFYTYSTNDNTAIYKYNDNTNYNPASMSSTGTLLQTNNQVVFTKEVPNNEGYLSVSPTILNGFEAEAGTASDPQSIAVIGNDLQANLTITAPTGYEVCATSNGTYDSTLTLIPSDGSILTNVFVRLNASMASGDYSGNLTLTSGITTATVSLSGTVINSTPQYTINASASSEEAGTVTGAGIYYENDICTLTALANEGYTFVNWTENDEVVSTENSYSFEVTGDRTLVANFEVSLEEETFTMEAGWNWWSSDLDITLEQLQAALVAALPGSTAITIKSKAGGTSLYNGTTWRGQLTSLDVTQMYKIQIETDCQITLTGTLLKSTEHTVTIVNGANWIAFPLNESMSIGEFFAGFPVNGDMVKSKSGVTTYNGTTWRGVLTTLEPGEGYIYKSNAEATRIFTFPNSTSSK